jgi:hypothetical protein
MFGVFGRLYTGEGMPAWEQVLSSQSRFQPAAWIAVVLDAAAAASCALLTVAFALVVVMRRTPLRPSAPKPERMRHGGESSNQEDPPGVTG